MSSDIDEILFTKRSQQALQWFQKLLRKEFSPNVELMGVLKDGVILCESINLLWPGSISEIIEKNSSIAFLENVNSFLTACEFVAGVPKEFLFEPQELISVKNPYKVLQTIHYLSSIVKEKGIKAPCIVDSDVSSVKKWKITPINLNSTPSSPLTPSSPYTSSPVDPGNRRALMTKSKTNSSFLKVPNLEGENKSSQTEVVRYIIDKLENLGTNQKLLLQNSNSYSSKLESVEFVNKSINVKMEQMMESINESFKQMQEHIRNLEETNTKLEKKLTDLEKTNERLKGSQLIKTHRSRPSDGSIDSDYSFDESSQERVSFEFDRDRRNPGRTFSTNSENTFTEEISLPSNVSAKRKRWFETEYATGVDINAVPKMESNRQDAIYELIDSEDDYVNDLNIMINVFMAQLKQLICEKDKSQIFSNVEQILFVNKEFLELLKAKRKATPVVMSIGDSFLKMNEYFKVYTSYCANHGAATNFLKKLIGTNVELKNLLNNITQKAEVKGLTLESYLIKPVQRICKYPLLIREIIKSTPQDHPDYEKISEAAEKIEAVLSSINEKTLHADTGQKILLLQSKIESQEPLELLQPSRRFLHEGLLIEYSVKQKKRKERYYVLFNDLLLICKPIGFNKSRYQLRKKLPSGMYLVNPTQVEVKEPAFELIFVGEQKFIIICPSEEERKKWVKFLEQASLDSISKKRAPTEDTEGDQKQIRKTLSSNEDSDDKANFRTSKAMKLLGLEESETSSNNAKRTTTIKEKKNIPGGETASSYSKDSASSLHTLPTPETLQNNVEELYLTTREYASKTEYELSFDRGSYVVVTNKKYDEFWKVEMMGVQGYVPASYLSKVDLSPQELKKTIEYYKTTPTKTVRANLASQPTLNGLRVSREGYSACGRIWRKVTTEQGISYYYCPDTYETCLELPSETGQQIYSWIEETIAHDPDWRLIENNSQKYYYNVKTKVTAWELPAEDLSVF